MFGGKRNHSAGTPDAADSPQISNVLGFPANCRYAASMSVQPVRLAREEDCAELARLAGELGYPASEETLRARLQRLLASSSDAVFVAERAAGGLVGWIHGVLSQFLESEYRVEIGGLVVDARFRRQGIGSDLVRRVEAWGLGHGVAQASVRCRTTRPESHRFYENLGYSQTKTQIVFRKVLPPRQPGNS